jgi:hypothetical protein
VIALAAASLALVAPWQPASATTTPSTTLLIEVLVTPKKVVVATFASSATHDGFITVGGPIPRGDFLNFQILNRTKHPLAFSAFGRRTPRTVKPGGKAHFNVLALKRGKYPYRVIVTGGKSFAGSFLVA